MDSDMHLSVCKRDGRKEDVSFDKILARIRKLADGLEHVNPDIVAQKVCTQLKDGMHTSELDEFAAETCAMMQARFHPNYGKLAARIVIDNHQKNTPQTLADCVAVLGNVVSESYVKLALSHNYQEMIVNDRDFMFDYFGFKTLERGYLLAVNGKTVERPQYMWMRVAIQLHGANLQRVKETYDALSQGYFIHATPTLFNSGTPHPQLSSCFLLQMCEDSIQGIYKTLGHCAQISKWAGGIGLNIHNVRAKDARIKGTNGKSTGIVPMLRVFNDTARYVNQGGKRNGSFAIYLEPWHADIEDFLRLKLNQGAEEERARDLFYGLWIPDLFMKRVAEEGTWTLMSPDECPGLSDCSGEAFEKLYTQYEAAGRGRKTVPAQKLWQMVLDAQIQTGTPYLCYKDAVNAKSNQKHLGTIKSSNLCVAPETQILIKLDDGSHRIDHPEICSLEGETVQVWNGNVWSNVTIRKTGESQKLLKVVVSINGTNTILYCTEYHKFILPTHKNIAECERVEAKDLVAGMILMGYTDHCAAWNSQKVVSVEFDGRYDDTYCFNESQNHAGVFNGILTGNCTEIMEYTAPDETAVCNLGSLSLPKFVKDGVFDFGMLREYTTVLTRNLDIVIDRNYYPTDECSRSNFRHRPIGIGVQGLADVFAMLRLPWQSEKARKLNREIFENMYFAALTESINGALTCGAYPSSLGSPISEGKLQYHLWNETPQTEYLDWPGLAEDARRYRCRNSLLIAPMPTASTSQILGNNECFEPFTTNLYSRRVLAGEFMVVNKYLVQDLNDLGLWTPDMRTEIMANNGSVQGIERIPPEVRELYKTAWEIPMKTIIQMSRDRAPFVCQSQSLNLFVAEPTYSKLSSMHFYAWREGLKTGCYYLRTKAASSAQKFTVAPDCLTCSA